MIKGFFVVFWSTLLKLYELLVLGPELKGNQIWVVQKKNNLKEMLLLSSTG